MFISVASEVKKPLHCALLRWQPLNGAYGAPLHFATRLSAPIFQAKLTEATSARGERFRVESRARLRPNTVERICGVTAPSGSSRMQQIKAERCRL